MLGQKNVGVNNREKASMDKNVFWFDYRHYLFFRKMAAPIKRLKHLSEGEAFCVTSPLKMGNVASIIGKKGNSYIVSTQLILNSDNEEEDIDEIPVAQIIYKPIVQQVNYKRTYTRSKACSIENRCLYSVVKVANLRKGDTVKWGDTTVRITDISLTPDLKYFIKGGRNLQAVVADNVSFKVYPAKGGAEEE